MVQGKSNLCGADLIELFDWTCTPRELSGVAVYLRELLLDPEVFTTWRCSQLLRWSTGRLALPCGGLPEKIKLIQHNGSRQHFPVSHTCSSEVAIPVYESSASLQGKLLSALDNSSDAFGEA